MAVIFEKGHSGEGKGGTLGARSDVARNECDVVM